MAIPDGITRDDVLRAVRDLDAGLPHSFGDPTKFDLVYGGKRYPPKAVVGLATRRLLGRPLRPDEFSGGDSPGAANQLLRSLGFTVMPKDRPIDKGAELSDTEFVRATVDTIVAEWRSRGGADPFDNPDAWLENRDAMLVALNALRVTGDVDVFADALGRLPNPPPRTRKGAHRTFLKNLAQHASGPDAASAIADAYSVPADIEEAAAKIRRLEALADEAGKIYPGPGFAPLAVSHAWCYQNPQEWPFLSVEAESALQALRLLKRYLPTAERYLRYRELVRAGSGDPIEASFALSYASEKGISSLSPSLYERLRENTDLLIPAYKAGDYASEEDRSRAERNINAVLGEFDLLARGLIEPVADRLVRALEVSKTDAKVAFDSPLYRADAYSVMTIEKDMAKPAIRVWATPSGLAIGAFFGARKAAEAAELAGELTGELPEGIEFFEVRPHRSGDRLAPAGDTYPGGPLFVGAWYSGGLTGTTVGDQVLQTVARLQPVFDRMVVAAGEPPGSEAQANDPLSELVAEFHAATGYPTEADLVNKAEREKMAEVISEEGLLGFDLHEFRSIYNSSRYGSTGPQSALNTSLGQMSPEELDTFAQNLEFLLRGTVPLPDRINALMDKTDRGISGLGESVITKLLAIEYPSEILPVYVYRGPKGKGKLLKLLDLHEEGLDDLEVGERLVRSNELLRDRLRPFFGDDTYGMKSFLYWLLDREEREDEADDETDHIGNLADRVLLPRETLEEIIGLLEDKGQVIFYGPPGTGKTFLAQELAKTLAPDASQRMLVQFHPSTSYEDFFEGYRPETDTQGRLTYRLVEGPLMRIAARAQENPSKKFVLVIDEINRANLPKVFGELLFLLEYRDASIRPLYRPDEPFELPKNLWIIGTMNTADRSIALIDAAMRRRFHFVRFFPDEGPMADILRSWLVVHDEPVWVADLLDMVNGELRERLGGPDLQIGPSHFMREGLNDGGMLERVWTFSVFPYIEEQLYGDQAAIRQYRFAEVMSRFQAKFAPDGELENELEEEGGDGSPAPGVE